MKMIAIPDIYIYQNFNQLCKKAKHAKYSEPSKEKSYLCIFFNVSAKTALFLVFGFFECSAFFSFDSGIFSPSLTCKDLRSAPGFLIASCINFSLAIISPYELNDLFLPFYEAQPNDA